jgi:predicted RNA-binding protein with TRAM domain
MEERRGYGRRGEFRGREDRSFAPKPVQVGQEYDVDIQELSRRGEGIARVQGLVIFVKNTKPNDHVRIKVTRISSRFAEAEVAGKSEAPAEDSKEETAEE